MQKYQAQEIVGLPMDEQFLYSIVLLVFVKIHASHAFISLALFPSESSHWLLLSTILIRQFITGNVMSCQMFFR